MAVNQGSTQTSLRDQTSGNLAEVTSAKRLKVDANDSTIAPGIPGSKIRLDDMNVANGGVARGTSITSTVTYTTVYNYLGSGKLYSFLVTLEGNLTGADPFNIKLEIDGVTVSEVSTLDVATSTIWNLSAAGDESNMGVSVANNTFRYKAPEGLTYATSVKVSVKKAAGGSKLFRAGLVHLTKET